MHTRTSERRHEHVALVHGSDFRAISSRRAVARARARERAGHAGVGGAGAWYKQYDKFMLLARTRAARVPDTEGKPIG